MSIIFRFESEHIFAKILFKEGPNKTFLNDLGFTQQMRGNRIGLLSEADTVSALQGGKVGLKNLLQGSVWGLVSHDGFDNAAGCWGCRGVDAGFFFSFT